MNIVRAKLLCVRAHNFTAIKDNFFQLKGGKPYYGLVPGTLQFLSDLIKAQNECIDLGLKDAALALERIKSAVDNQQMDASRLQGEAEHAYNAYVDGVNKLKYIWVPEVLCSYVDQDRLFGDEVWAKFPDARHDIKEAGNCIAVECGTAAVFHLMRVAEHGVRALAKKLNVKLTHKGQRQPIEYGDWNDVISGIRIQITAARQLSRGPSKQRRLEFYSDVVDQCEYMRDIWRNTISHARRPYRTTEAIGVKERVEEFMVRLASGLAKTGVSNASRAASASSKPSHVRRFRTSGP